MATDDKKSGRDVERDVEREAALFRAITESAQDSIFCKDTELRYTFVNPAMARLFSCRPEDLLGRSPAELFTPEDAAKVAEADEPVLRGEVTDLVRTIEVEGERRYFHTVQAPVRGEDGQVQAICGIVRDITARTHAETALVESESIVRSFYDNSPLMMGVMELVDDDVELLSLNTSFAGFLGLERDQAHGCRLSTLSSHRSTVALWVEQLHQSATLGRPVQFEYEHDTRWLLASVSFIGRFTEQRSRFSCVINDVTERKEEEAKRAALEEQLRQSQKMDAVGLLAGGVAHDFNNLLTAILGFADVVDEQLESDADAKADLDEIRRAGETAASLTEQLLAFSRRQTISPRNLELNSIVSRSERMLQRVIGENLKLRFAPAPDLWGIRIDPAQADQLLVNLAVNARDAMPQTGTLTFRTRNVHVDEHVCRGCGETFVGEHVLLEIEDTGDGMDPSTLDRIFEPFFTTKAKGKGTGLGLATVHGIVHQNSGHQEVTSVEGEGTRFRFYFPRVHTIDVERPDSGQLPGIGGGETVIVAEDQETVRRLVVRKLQDSGYQVFAAEDGAEAVRLADDLKSPPALLVADVVMPNLNGRQLYDQLRQRWPNLRVLYMSGYSEDVIGRQKILDPDTQFLKKPFKIKTLLRRVRDVIDTPDSLL